MMKYNIDRIFGSVITKTVEDKNRHMVSNIINII